jgi:hypothetical protein
MKDDVDIIKNNILKCFHENPSDVKITWINCVFDHIFKHQYFIDEIKKSKYLILDMKNKCVSRKLLNVNASVFVPSNTLVFNNENTNPKLNVNEPEYIPKNFNEMYHTEIISNNMVDSLFY